MLSCRRFPKPSVENLPPVVGDRISKEIEFIYELIVALGMGSEYYGTLPPENREQITINYETACALRFSCTLRFCFTEFVLGSVVLFAQAVGLCIKL
jgi:hypothetical protein